MTLGGHEEDRYRGSLAIHVHPRARTCTHEAHVCPAHGNLHHGASRGTCEAGFVRARGNTVRSS